MRTEIVDLAEALKRPLTASEIAQIEAVAGREPDIDDIPEAPPGSWASAERGKFYKPREEPISFRIDMDILDWLRRSGPGYQTKIDRILREQMNAEITAPTSAS